MRSIKISPLKKPVKAEISIPGSKSYTNRALLLSSLTGKSVEIVNPLISDDTKAMIECLKRLGIKVLQKVDNIEVLNDINSIKDRSYNLNARLSGTTMRFILALAAITSGAKTLSGGEGLNKRPIGELVEGLRQLGAKIEYLGKEGYPPVRVLPSKLSPGTIKMRGSVSSQYISAILMIAPLIGKITIEVIGGQVSKPYIDMTIDAMKQFGVTISNGEHKRYIIPGGQKYNINQYIVEADVSSASYFFAIAALTKSVLTVKNINPESAQADMRFLKILKKMGNKITYRKDEVTITGKGIKPVRVDMQDCPDQIQTLGVLAAFADGVTKITGIQSLRLKETDRVVALERELKKMGIKTSSTHDTLVIHGGNPKPAKIDTYGDHRMAMSFAIAAALLSGMEINDPDVVGKTFPDFWKKLNSIGIKTRPNYKNIVLIGIRGSGKTTTAKLLSQRLNRDYLELDEIIVEKTGMSIPEIVEKYGWDYFRDKESEIAEDVSVYNDKIISTGGGIVTRSKNVEALKKNGVLILLTASIETLLHRIENDKNFRPFLTNKKTRREEIEELLNQRKELYEQAADEIIDTTNLDPEEVVNKIMLKLKRGNI